MPEVGNEMLTFYTGKFPTTAGNFQRLIIREAVIPVISLKDLGIIGQTENKYIPVGKIGLPWQREITDAAYKSCKNRHGNYPGRDVVISNCKRFG